MSVLANVLTRRRLGPVLVRLLASAGLAATAAVLVSCGSSGKGLIPLANAGPLRSDFEAVAQAAQNGDGNCEETQAKLNATERDFAALPSSIDAGLHQRLEAGIKNLRERALALCAQPITQTNTVGTTAHTTTTPAPTTSETTPTTTPTTTTQTTPSTPAPKPPNGGTVAPGAEGNDEGAHGGGQEGGHGGGQGPSHGAGQGSGHGGGQGAGQENGGVSESGGAPAGGVEAGK